jgi:hypothetical protein
VTSCIVDSAAICIMVVKFRNTICSPQPQLSLHRRAALSSNSNGTRSYIAERTQSTVYIVRCLWYVLSQLSFLMTSVCVGGGAMTAHAQKCLNSTISLCFSSLVESYFKEHCHGKSFEFVEQLPNMCLCSTMRHSARPLSSAMRIARENCTALCCIAQDRV